jgi:hypothetical protein
MTYPDNIIAAFREVALGLMDWQDPPLMSWREYRRREGITGGGSVYRPYDPQGDVEPYDVQADWDEHGI